MKKSAVCKAWAFFKQDGSMSIPHAGNVGQLMVFKSLSDAGRYAWSEADCKIIQVEIRPVRPLRKVKT